MSYYCNDHHCVCNVVRKIAVAQEDVASRNADCCTTGCDQSIRDLLSPAGNNQVSGFTTIPFMLYCKCSPFVATGIIKQGGSYQVFNTPFFRVKKVSGNDGCCATIELLYPISTWGSGDSFNFSDIINDSDSDNITGLTGGQGFTNFLATGVCITVDLSTFNGIQCLSPITPISIP